MYNIFSISKKMKVLCLLQESNHFRCLLFSEKVTLLKMAYELQYKHDIRYI